MRIAGEKIVFKEHSFDNLTALIVCLCVCPSERKELKNLLLNDKQEKIAVVDVVKRFVLLFFVKFKRMSEPKTRYTDGGYPED